MSISPEIPSIFGAFPKMVHGMEALLLSDSKNAILAFFFPPSFSDRLLIGIALFDVMHDEIRAHLHMTFKKAW